MRTVLLGPEEKLTTRRWYRATRGQELSLWSREEPRLRCSPVLRPSESHSLLRVWPTKKALGTPLKSWGPLNFPGGFSACFTHTSSCRDLSLLKVGKIKNFWKQILEDPVMEVFRGHNFSRNGRSRWRSIMYSVQDSGCLHQPYWQKDLVPVS